MDKSDKSPNDPASDLPSGEAGKAKIHHDDTDEDWGPMPDPGNDEQK